MNLDLQTAFTRMNEACAKIGRPIQVMEVCGTHTVSIFRGGIRTLLPKTLKLLSGPGCPVCVTDQSYIDVVLKLVQRPDILIATYGDMIRVPGSAGSLETLGLRNVQVVVSSDDAVQLALKNPTKIVVFLAVGFETTTPSTAVAVAEAERLELDNFCVLCGHKVVVPAMNALLGGMNHRIDAFLCPGHVTVIIGSDAYRPVVERFGVPCVVAGFEPLQILSGLAEICQQLADKRPQVSSVYHAVVTPKGNLTAQKLISQYFEPYDGLWRGLGRIPMGSLRFRAEYRLYDALARFGIDEVPGKELPGCRCGEVLCGLIDPPDCAMFAKVCNPETPIGPCMVSSEGACSAWYKYGHMRSTHA
jgi:hydrogenase expression/formation protein HypD